MNIQLRTKKELGFVAEVEKRLKNNTAGNKRSNELLAASFGISNKNLVKELTELAIVRVAREISLQKTQVDEKYNNIVELYNSQVNLSHRTSHSILLQQYSTPAPIAYIAGIYAGLPVSNNVFEPSAGNGLLTIASPTTKVDVNEVDEIRLANLFTQNYNQVTNFDASEPFQLAFSKKYEGVITNPPFGRLPEQVNVTDPTGETWPIKDLDHYMAINALNCMQDNGKAAIIIGNHTKYDEKGRIQAGKNRSFLSYLYKNYHVDDIIPIDGHALYSRQGTAFNTRLILINGRKKKPGGFPPLKDFNPIVKSFQHLFSRVIMHTIHNAMDANRSPLDLRMYNYLDLRDSILTIPKNLYFEIKYFRNEKA